MALYVPPKKEPLQSTVAANNQELATQQALRQGAVGQTPTGSPIYPQSGGVNPATGGNFGMTAQQQSMIDRERAARQAFLNTPDAQTGMLPGQTPWTPQQNTQSSQPQQSFGSFFADTARQALTRNIGQDALAMLQGQPLSTAQAPVSNADLALGLIPAGGIVGRFSRMGVLRSGGSLGSREAARLGLNPKTLFTGRELVDDFVKQQAARETLEKEAANIARLAAKGEAILRGAPPRGPVTVQAALGKKDTYKELQKIFYELNPKTAALQQTWLQQAVAKTKSPAVIAAALVTIGVGTVTGGIFASIWWAPDRKDNALTSLTITLKKADELKEWDLANEIRETIRETNEIHASIPIKGWLEAGAAQVKAGWLAIEASERAEAQAREQETLEAKITAGTATPEEIAEAEKRNPQLGFDRRAKEQAAAQAERDTAQQERDAAFETRRREDQARQDARDARYAADEEARARRSEELNQQYIQRQIEREAYDAERDKLFAEREAERRKYQAERDAYYKKAKEENQRSNLKFGLFR